MLSRIPTLLLAASLVTLPLAAPAQAGPLRALLGRGDNDMALDANAGAKASPRLPAGSRVQRDLAYGSDPLQRLDVYLPPPRLQEGPMPVIVMVHGGGWRRGDKDSSTVVDNKAARWLPRGLVFVSVNYRLLPDADPAQQADDVAHALAWVQQHAGEWQADPQRIVLMGHSAGAHLVSLLGADPSRVQAAGGRPWLGTVALDSAAEDVEAVMQRRHLRLYDKAFGKDPAFWQSVSPLRQLKAGTAPQLLVCSTERRDHPCDQARTVAKRAAELGVRAQVLPQALSHRHINEDLGLPGAYTDAVEKFMGSLDPELQRRLQARQ